MVDALACLLLASGYGVASASETRRARLTCQNFNLLFSFLWHRHQTDRCLSRSQPPAQDISKQIPYLPAFTSTPLFPLYHSLKQPVLPYHPSTKSSSIGRSQLYVKKNSHAASIINKVSNNSAKRRALHRIPPPYSSTAFASPPFPTRPGISIPIGCRSGGLLMAKNRRRTRKKRTERGRRMSFIGRRPAMTTD
jgi:hypothetical protein